MDTRVKECAADIIGSLKFKIVSLLRKNLEWELIFWNSFKSRHLEGWCSGSPLDLYFTCLKDMCSAD
jgi:hypothetical protein